MPQEQRVSKQGVTGGAAGAVPGVRGVDHIGLTVPSLEDALAFFTGVLGGEVVYRMGPFVDDDGTWFADELDLDPRARIPHMALVRCGTGANFELFEYQAPDQRTELPRMSDWGGHHVALYVDDLEPAVAALRAAGVRVLGQVKPGMGPEAGPGTGWCFFHTPWGLPMELVSYPQGRAYEADTAARLWHPAHPER